jgi:hypothetical protein
MVYQVGGLCVPTSFLLPAVPRDCRAPSALRAAPYLRAIYRSTRRLDILMEKIRIHFENTNRKSAGLSPILMNEMRGEVLFRAAFALDTPRAVVTGQMPHAMY